MADKKRFTVDEMAALTPDACGVYHFPGNIDYTDIKEFAHASVFGGDCIFGNTTVFRAWCRFGPFCTFRDGVVFKTAAVFQGLAHFGRTPSFTQYTVFGDFKKFFGGKFTVEGLEFYRLMHMSGVDGSGRSITLLFGAKPVDDRVIAGCFFGTPEEFVKRAKAEGKPIYAEVIPAVIAATRKHLKEINGASGSVPSV